MNRLAYVVIREDAPLDTEVLIITSHDQDILVVNTIIRKLPIYGIMTQVMIFISIAIVFHLFV